MPVLGAKWAQPRLFFFLFCGNDKKGCGARGKPRKFKPELYFSGDELAIARSVYEGDTALVSQIPAEAVNRVNDAGICMLIYAIHVCNEPAMEILLRKGADINIQQKATKVNALLKASKIVDYEMVNHLLDRGADPMLRDTSGDCLAYSVQYDIQKGRGTDHYKQILQELKQRLEGMGVQFPVERIPPPEEAP